MHKIEDFETKEEFLLFENRFETIREEKPFDPMTDDEQIKKFKIRFRNIQCHLNEVAKRMAVLEEVRQGLICKQDECAGMMLDYWVSIYGKQ